jgi:hypothetical protein
MSAPSYREVSKRSPLRLRRSAISFLICLRDLAVVASPQELATLSAAIEQLLTLPATQQLLQLNSNTCERAFEAYLFALCCEAVRQAEGTVTLTGIQSGPQPTTLVFRGAPGSMASDNQDFVYASCSLNGRRFEIHVDVEYQGTSGALHEIDVSLCDEAHAETVRRTARTPKTDGNKLLMAFECKFYESTPGVGLGRTFVGLISDCGTLRLKGFVTNIPSDKLGRYFSKNSRPEPFLGVVPTDPESEARFVYSVEQELRKWA